MLKKRWKRFAILLIIVCLIGAQSYAADLPAEPSATAAPTTQNGQGGHTVDLPAEPAEYATPTAQNGESGHAVDLPGEPVSHATSTARNGQDVLAPVTGAAPAQGDGSIVRPAAQSSIIDLVHAAEPGYLDEGIAAYADGVVHIVKTDAPVHISGSSSALSLVCRPGVVLMLDNVTLEGDSTEPLISWEAPTTSDSSATAVSEASITFRGNCQINNTGGIGIEAPGDLTLSPSSQPADTISVNAQTTCLQSGGMLTLSGNVTLRGQNGIISVRAHLTAEETNSCVTIYAQDYGLQCKQDVLLQGCASIQSNQVAVSSGGSVEVENAFISVEGGTVDITCAGEAVLASSTIFVENITDMNGQPKTPVGTMGEQGAYVILGLDPQSAYTIQEARSTWGEGRELKNIYPTQSGTLQYYTLGSATDEGRRYAIILDENTHTITFDSLSQTYRIDLSTLTSQPLPDGVTLEAPANGESVITLNIDNPEAQITLYGEAYNTRISVQRAQYLMLDNATIHAHTDYALAFESAGETALLLRGANTIDIAEDHAGITLRATNLHIRQSGGSGSLFITGSGRGISSVERSGIQNISLESGSLDANTGEEALSINGAFSLIDGKASLYSTNSSACVKVSSLYVSGGQLTASAQAADSYGIRTRSAELSAGIVAATGQARGLSTQSIIMRNATLNAQALSENGTGLVVENTADTSLDGHLLISNYVVPLGLSGDMMSGGPHVVGSLDPNITYEFFDETQGSTVLLGTVKPDSQGQVVYYCNETNVDTIVFGDDITLVNEQAYVDQTLASLITGIRVSGLIPFNARLSVIGLTGRELTAVELAAGRSQVLFPVDIQVLSPEGQKVSCESELTVTFPIGEEYNGQTLNVIHILPTMLGSQELERIPGTVENGNLSIRCTSLSAFAVQLPAPASHAANPTPTPQPLPANTATTSALWLFIALCVVMCGWAIIVLRQHKKLKPKSEDRDSSTNGKNKR